LQWVVYLRFKLLQMLQQAVLQQVSHILCDSKLFQVSGGSYYKFDPSTNAYSSLGSDSVSNLNGIGYNTKDNAVYGMSGSTLYRIYGDGKMYSLGPVSYGAGSSAVSTGGDFYPGAGDNKLVNASASKWTITDVYAKTATNFTLNATSSNTPSGQTWKPYDLAIKGNKAYGFDGDDEGLYIADLSSTGVTKITKKAVTWGNTTAQNGQYGAAYIDRSDDLYFFSNTGTKLYKITAASAASTTPQINLVVDASITGSMNDGASCPNAPSPFAAPDAVDDDYGVVPGTTFTANTTPLSVFANDTSGVAMKLKTVKFGATTLTNPSVTNSITSGGVTLTITDWNLGYFTVSGLSSPIQWEYTSLETATSSGQSGPRTAPATGTAKVFVAPLMITKPGPALTTGYVNTSYTNSMTASANTGASAKTYTGAGPTTCYYYWEVSPALPAGLSLNSCTGEITGTPTVAQSATTYTFKVGVNPSMTTSVSGTFTLEILAGTPPSADPADLEFTQELSFAVQDQDSASAKHKTHAGGVTGADLPIVVTPTSKDSTGTTVTELVSQATIGMTSITPSVCTVASGDAAAGFVITWTSGTTGICTLEATRASARFGGNYSASPKVAYKNYSSAAPVRHSFNIGKITTSSSLPASYSNVNYSQTIAETGLPSGGTWALGTITNTTTSGSGETGWAIDSSGNLTRTNPPVGTYSIVVTYNVNGVTISKTFTVVISAPPTHPQVITHTYNTNIAWTNATSTINITASTNATGLFPTMTSATTSICTVPAGGTSTAFVVTILGPGECILDANQAGDSTYDPAVQVTQHFHIIGISTASIPNGTVGSGYSVQIFGAGTFPGCTFDATGLPAGISIDADGNITGIPNEAGTYTVAVTVTCGLVTYTKSYNLVIGGTTVQPPTQQAPPTTFVPVAPVAPVTPAEVVEPTPTPTPTPTYVPRPVVTPSPTPSPVVIALPPVEVLVPTETIWERVGRFLENIWNGISTPKNTGQIETRSLAHLSQESLKGFKPNQGVEVDVIGAKTGGQFVVTPGNVDDLGVVAALKESMPRNEAAFAKIDNVTVLKNADYSNTFKGTIGKTEKALFLASGLEEPKSVYGLYIGQNSKWIQVKASVKTYLPGTKVFLAVTTSPIIFGSAEVDKYGKATIVGQLPLNAVASGAHSLRVVGVRSLDGISASGSGEIQINSKAMDEIKKFDAGTMATVTALGKGFSGGYNTVVREVPLERPVQWWPVWLALIIGVLTLLYRYYYWRKAGKNQRKLIATVVAGIAGIPAAIVGWVDITYEIWLGVAIAAGFVVLNLIWRKKAMFEQAFDRIQDEFEELQDKVEDKVDDIQADLKRPRRRK
jgi:hypothetical protein